jgi:hypothetical protein
VKHFIVKSGVRGIMATAEQLYHSHQPLRQTLIKTALTVCAGSLVCALIAGCSPQVKQPGQGERNQLIWGSTVYRLQCARCHESGRVAPGLTEERLVRYQDANNLFAYIRQNMPLDKPGALPEDDYWDVTAYILAKDKILLVPEQTVLNQKNAPQVQFTAK